MAAGITASGHIVGTCQEQTAHGFKTHGFLYINGLYATFDHPSTDYWTTAKAINVLGHIVGDYSDRTSARQSGFLYINGLYAKIDYPSAISSCIGDQRQRPDRRDLP